MDQNNDFYGGFSTVYDMANELEQLKKSFEAGSDTTIANMTGGQAGRVQSIESTFKLITHQASDATLWKDIPKDKATSTVLEYATIDEVGNLITYPEGGDIDDQADSLHRKYDVTKYMGTKGSVTFVAQNVKMLQEAETTEVMNKTRALVRGLDQLLVDGDNSINPLEFDGIIKKVTAGVKNPTQNIIDLRGKRMSDMMLNEACTVIGDNYGNTTNLQFWLSFQAAKTWVDDKISKQSYITNFNGGINQDQALGNTFEKDNGKGLIKKDVFMRPKDVVNARICDPTFTSFAKNHTKAPDAPTAVITSVATNNSPYSLDDGDYDYAIVPINVYGRGLAYEGTITHTGGGKMTQFVVTKAGTGEATLGYEIYRRAGASTNIKDYKFIGKYAMGSNPVTLYDNATNLPGTSTAFIADWDSDQVICFKQLLPVYRLMYGIRADKLEWLQKIYGVLQIFNPNKIVVIKNIGDTPNS